MQRRFRIQFSTCIPMNQFWFCVTVYVCAFSLHVAVIYGWRSVSTAGSGHLHDLHEWCIRIVSLHRTHTRNRSHLLSALFCMSED